MEIHISPSFIVNTSSKVVYKVTPAGRVKLDDDVRAVSLGLRIFRDRMHGWFFAPAKHLLSNGENVAALHLIAPLIEALEERYQGKSSDGQSNKFFLSRAAKLFGFAEDSPQIRALHKGVRCGFAHHGFLSHSEKVLITSMGDAPMNFDSTNSILYIAAQPFVAAVERAFHQHFEDAQNDPDLQARFGRTWYPDLQLSLDMEVSGVP